MAGLEDVSARTIDGRDVPLSTYAGQVLLVVNTASRCGFTPQYAGLEELHRRFSPRGFAVLGFPCNQFAHQEPGSDSEIASFCDTTYGVSFPMFGRIDVNGPGTHPLYVYLKGSRPGLFGTGAIKWNFTKFLLDRTGKVVDRCGPAVTPAKLAPRIEKLL